MKKRIELKIVLIIGLFLAGLILLIFGNKSKYCLGFGLVILGVACLLYSIESVKNAERKYREISQNFDAYEGNDILILEEYNRNLKGYKRQSLRTKIVFYLFSGLLIILGIMSMI